jgi:hypothetical protein
LRRTLERRLQRAFNGGATSGATAFEVAGHGLAAAGWHVAAIESWPDVDTAADLERLAVLLGADGRWAPRTAEWLQQWPAAIDGR